RGLRAPFSRLTQGRARCRANRPARSRSISPAARRKFPRSRVARPNAGWPFPAGRALRISSLHKLWLSSITCHITRINKSLLKKQLLEYYLRLVDLSRPESEPF